MAAVPFSLAPVGSTRAQEEDPVIQLMAQMSNAAKVGQLFLVTFPGSEVGEDTIVAELIRDYHVGGVMLLPENGNIVNEGNTPAQVTALVDQLQEAAWAATQPVTQTLAESGEEEGGAVAEGEQAEWVSPGPFIPLFVAVRHEGNGMPFTSIISGTTPLPSEMALGSTWNPSYAETVGQIVGQELRALGINMLLGPSLDVLEIPRPESAGDPGVRVFGGQPFWVGQMGQAYIRGVHAGSEGQIGVIAKHFPGQGASDRSLQEEISTVQRTLEKLRQIDLAPFSAAAQAKDPLARPDGVLVSHIRFRGLEGTRPVSVDSQVLQRLLDLPEMASWRAQGGVTISDGLGARALRRFYDPSEESFNSRHIARDAFLAGNDILLLSQFALGEGWDVQVANIQSTITFFRERYDSDPSFRASVDAAVARILRLKLKLNGGAFGLTPPEAEPTEVEAEAPTPDEQAALQREVLSAISREAVTLLFPSSPDQVPPPPTSADTIVLFTDGREGLPCATCAPVPYIGPLALRDTILRLYGPDATGQVNPSLLTSFTFDQLDGYMDVPSPPPTPTPESEGATATLAPLHPIAQALRDADWVIFAMLDPSGDPPQSRVVRRFLAERADALRNPRLIVLAYDAPYYLDATEISKLSAYYVVYSRIESFIESSVRALFDEFAPVGAPPVSVNGINYDLSRQTSPDPDQTVTLYYNISTLPEEGTPTPEPTEEGQPTPKPPQPQIGDELELHTGVIADHNGHPVPDGTLIQFIFTYPREGLEHSVIETTLGGVAETTIMLDRTGQLDISLETDPFPRTVVLQIVIPEDQVAIVLTPTPVPTHTPTPTPTATPTPEPSPVPPETPTPTTPAPVEEEEEAAPPREYRGLALALALVAILVTGGTGYYIVRLNSGPVSVALRLALWCMISGLSLYLVYALRLPGADLLRERGGLWAAVLMALLGGATPLIVVWIARQWQRLS